LKARRREPASLVARPTRATPHPPKGGHAHRGADARRAGAGAHHQHGAKPQVGGRGQVRGRGCSPAGFLGSKTSRAPVLLAWARPRRPSRPPHPRRARTALTAASLHPNTPTPQNNQPRRSGNSVAMKIEGTNATEVSRCYGRHFDHNDQLVSKISRESINALKSHFQDEMTKDDWRLVGLLGRGGGRGWGAETPPGFPPPGPCLDCSCFCSLRNSPRRPRHAPLPPRSSSSRRPSRSTERAAAGPPSGHHPLQPPGRGARRGVPRRAAASAGPAARRRRPRPGFLRFLSVSACPYQLL
jgi:hypothetical protein